MPAQFFLLLAALTAAFATPASAELRRFLYCSSPDGAQAEGKSGTGLLIFASTPQPAPRFS